MSPRYVSRLLWAAMLITGNSASALFLPAPEHTLFHDDFESKMIDPSFWTISGGASVRLLNIGGNHCVRFRSPDSSGAYYRGELTFQVDLAAYESVRLGFKAMARGVLTPPPDHPFVGGCDGNGVAISPDGNTWYPVRDFNDLTFSFQEIVINLDDAIEAWSLNYSDPFHIRFFFYVAWQETDGALWRTGRLDDIQLVGLPKSVHNYGHAPDPPYPGMRFSDGARHMTGGAVLLGTNTGIDRDAPGDATRRDGVSLPDFFTVGETAALQITVPAACKLDAWFDFNNDGHWTTGENVFDSVDLNPGLNALLVTVPSDAVPSDQSWARFRVSSAGGLDPTGACDDGEVEDYPLVILPAQPTPAPLPTYSSGFENTITWDETTPGDVYQVERSLTALFDVVEDSSGWIANTSHTFYGLEDEQTHFYRVRAGREMPQRQESWRQNRAAAFLDGTATDVSVHDDAGLRLAPVAVPTRAYNHVADSSTFQAPMLNSGYMNFIQMTQEVSLHEVAFILEASQAVQVEFFIYEGGATPSEPYDLEISLLRDIAPGRGFVSTGKLEPPVTLQQGVCYCLGVSAADHVSISVFSPLHKEEFSYASSLGGAEMHEHPAPDEWTGSISSVYSFDMRLTTLSSANYRTSGEYMSPIITKAPDDSWTTLHYLANAPANTTLRVDVFSETGVNPLPGFSDVPSGTSLAGLPIDALRLRARLETTTPNTSPALLDWQVSRHVGAPYHLVSEWSEPVSSMQVNTPPTVASITLLDPTPTRAGTARFALTFSQPVTIGPAAVNSALHVDAPPASSAEIIALEGSNADYVVTAATGDVSGNLRLIVNASTHIENAFGLALAEDFTSGPSYTLDFIAPTVQSITRLHPEVPDEWPVAWRVVFSEPVFNVSETDFTLTGVADAQISAIAGTGAMRDLYLQPGATEGVVRLEVVTGGGLVDQVGWPLAAPYADGPTYTIDFEAPYVASISRIHPETPTTDIVAFAVFFSEPVYDVSLADFELTGMANAELHGLSGSGTLYAVNIIAGDMDGDARLDVILGGTLRDWAGRPLREDYRYGPAYLFDLYPPRVYAVTLLDPPVTNRPIVRFQVQFNKSVFNVETTPPFSDFELAGTASGAILSVEGSDAAYIVSVDSGETEGTLRLDVSDAGTLHDHLGRGLGERYDSGPAYQIQWLHFIETPPESVTAFLGHTLSLRAVSSGGTAPVAHQWFKSADGVNFAPIMGGDAPLLILQTLDWDDAGYYYCEAADFYQTVVSPTTQVIVEEIPLGSDGAHWLIIMGLALALTFVIRLRPARGQRLSV